MPYNQSYNIHHTQPRLLTCIQFSLFGALLLLSLPATAHPSYDSPSCELNEGHRLPQDIKLNSMACDFVNGYSEGELVPVQSKHPNANQKYKFGFVNRDGKLVIPLQYDDAFGFHYGLAGVKMGDKWGYINTDNVLVIPLQYDYADNFHNERALVKKDGKLTYIDMKGKPITDLEFDHTVWFNRNGLATVGKTVVSTRPKSAFDNAKWGMIDKQGNVVTPLKYDFTFDCVPEGCEGFHGEHVIVGVHAKSDNGTVEMDSNGNAIVRYGLVNEQGVEVIPPIYDKIAYASEGLVAVAKGNKVGFVDLHNELVIPFAYQSTEYDYQVLPFLFSEGLVAVKKDDKWGYIDHHNQTIIDFIYDEVEQFDKGLAVVKKDGKWGVIDRYNGVIVDFIYDSIWLDEHHIKASMETPNDYRGEKTWFDRRGTQIDEPKN